MEIMERISEMILLYGTQTVNKVTTDMSNSRHTSNFLSEVRYKKILPNGDSCVACVLSNWKYGLAGPDKIRVGAYYILGKSIEVLISIDFLPSESIVLESIEEIDDRIKKMRFK